MPIKAWTAASACFFYFLGICIFKPERPSSLLCEIDVKGVGHGPADCLQQALALAGITDPDLNLELPRYFLGLHRLSVVHNFRRQ
jgi:hypothetical protein